MATLSACSSMRCSASGGCCHAELLLVLVSQGMAGNIVHAIATTNAIISGLIAVQALKILSDNSQLCKVARLLPHTCRLLTEEYHAMVTAGLSLQMSACCTRWMSEVMNIYKNSINVTYCGRPNIISFCSHNALRNHTSGHT